MNETSVNSPESFSSRVRARLSTGARFGGLFATARGPATQLRALLMVGGSVLNEDALVDAETRTYPSLVPVAPSAAWYEREISDVFGLKSLGGRHLNPLVFPFSERERPRPGSASHMTLVRPDLTPLPVHLSGEGVFTIPYGPVRSGVFESVEYLVETPGEDIPHLRSRVFYKHRGVEVSFEGRSAEEGALIAERCEGVASVAHASAYSQAVERLAGVEIPGSAQFIRLVHAELERIANHLDSIIRHCDGAGQAVAYARFTLHKEHIQRLRAQLCGSRFGRGVVVPGGVRRPLGLSPAQLRDSLSEIEKSLNADMRLLMATPSFLDRLRATGILSAEIARRYGALGPIGRASGELDDIRSSRPYGAYQSLNVDSVLVRLDGDALARQRVRIAEIEQSLDLIAQALNQLEGTNNNEVLRVDLGTLSGESVGWVEAPQGELLYLVEVRDGVLARVKPRSASFHNFALFPSAFPKDILTDFVFIEASFGISIAGVAS